MLATCVACQPSREALTAGQVGCPANELTIYEGTSSSGWNQSAETWTAECRGRRFICSEVTTSSVDITWIFTDSTDSRDSDISCREELAQAPAPRRADANGGGTAPTAAPPAGAAGFEFGTLRAQAQTLCQAAGHAWSEGESARAHCSGTVASVGLEASTELAFCADRLCGITVSHVPSSKWAAAFAGLEKRLAAKYGKPSYRDVRIPSACETDDSFDRCASDGSLSLKQSWQWPDGQKLHLLLGKAAGVAVSSVQLVYARPDEALRADASGL